MAGVKRTRRDFIQNIAIVVLTLSAVALFAQSQLYNLESSNGGLGSLLTATSVSSSSGTMDLNSVSAPVRVAVTGAYGRYGNISLSTTDEEFLLLRTLLGEVLGSAKNFTTCTAADFQSTLSGISVYYDFLEPLPLSLLAAMMGEESPSSEISARYLVVFAQSQQVYLCLWDGLQTYLMANTAVIRTELVNTVGGYELTGAAFAFDNAEVDPLYSTVSPYSLFPAEMPQLSVLAASNPLSDTSTLLTALGFNPHTNNRYSESSGTEVILEGDQTLRIRPDGLVSYQGGSEPTITIKSAGDSPTVNEAVLGAVSFLNELLDGASGDASLYLLSIQQTVSSTTLQFGYQLGGVPIRFSDGQCAAEVSLSDSVITSFWIRFRQYASSGEDSLLLPLRQALAVAASYNGAELTITYADDGEDTVSAQWLAE